MELHLIIILIVISLLSTALEQFKKDFASQEKSDRDKELKNRQLEMERRRLKHLEREN